MPYLYFILLTMLVLDPGARDRIAEEPVTINIQAVAGLQFDVVRFAVKPGQRVNLILTNKDDMSHNMLITKPGARMTVVEAALSLAERGPAMHYIPETTDVLWSIPVLSPGEQQSLTFVAPKAGAYPYVCTFPGHGYVMYGVMYVSGDGTMPALQDDPNVPDSRKSASKASPHAHKSNDHPYKQEPPYLYRAYMEDASPAAIAVHLPGDISYCWDAATCELRYAWKGGFVDNTGLWKGKPNAVARVTGEKFFQIRIRHPLRIGAIRDQQEAQFRGYRLIDRYPEFHYTLDGIDVYELVRSNGMGTGLKRTFRIPEARSDVFFVVHDADGAVYECAEGEAMTNGIRIPRDRAKMFTINMNQKHH